jgi:hypothetical protein
MQFILLFSYTLVPSGSRHDISTLLLSGVFKKFLVVLCLALVAIGIAIVSRKTGESMRDRRATPPNSRGKKTSRFK